MPITITGKKQMIFKLYFNNYWQKFLTIFDILNIGGLHLTSSENSVIIQPVKPVRSLNKYIFDVYYIDQYDGRLQSK